MSVVRLECKRESKVKGIGMAGADMALTCLRMKINRYMEEYGITQSSLAKVAGVKWIKEMKMLGDVRP